MLMVTAVSTFGAGSTVSSGGETYFGVLACARLEAVGRVGRRHFSFYLIEFNLDHRSETLSHTRAGLKHKCMPPNSLACAKCSWAKMFLGEPSFQVVATQSRKWAGKVVLLWRRYSPAIALSLDFANAVVCHRSATHLFCTPFVYFSLRYVASG